MGLTAEAIGRGEGAGEEGRGGETAVVREGGGGGFDGGVGVGGVFERGWLGRCQLLLFWCCVGKGGV